MNKIKSSQLKNFCRVIYDRYMFTLLTADINKEQLENILQMPNYDLALDAFLNLIASTEKCKIIFKSAITSCGLSVISTVFDVLYFYRRNLHFSLQSIPNLEITNTTILEKVNKDLCVEINLEDKKTSYAVYVFKRTTPIYIHLLQY